MARNKIVAPKNFPFSTLIPIRITDINYGGHVGNDTILSLLHEARVQFLESFHYTEMEFAGTSLIMSDVAMEFKKEVFYGDALKAYVGWDNISRVSFDIIYKLEKNNEEVVAIARTGMVCYNYQSKKIVSLPNEVKELWQEA